MTEIHEFEGRRAESRLRAIFYGVEEQDIERVRVEIDWVDEPPALEAPEEENVIPTTGNPTYLPLRTPDTVMEALLRRVAELADEDDPLSANQIEALTEAEFNGVSGKLSSLYAREMLDRRGSRPYRYWVSERGHEEIARLDEVYGDD